MTREELKTPACVADWAALLEKQGVCVKVVGDATRPVTALGTDSREAAPGLLFFALTGERFDAHDFVASVAEAGAAGAVVSREMPLPAACAGFVQIVVPDVGRAYGEAARAWRLLGANLRQIAVGGSNGKTTTTQMIASILEVAWGEKAHATRGNLNNLVGVPKTLLALRPDTEAAVVEAGMNHPGEMALLARWIAPTVAVLTNAQREHQEFLAGVRETAHENGLLIAGLREGGTAVWPAADGCADVWQSLATARGVRGVTFGLADGAEGESEADVLGRDMEDGRLAVTSPWGDVTVTLGIAGRHNKLNALAAAAATLAVGADLSAVKKGLEAFRPVKGRGERFRDEARGLLLTDETYNANPDSVRAAAAVLAQAAESTGERCFILGDMGETGDQAHAFHREVGAFVRSLGIERFWCVGDLARFAADAFGPGARHFGSVEALLAALPELPAENLTVTVKASRFMRLERVVEALRTRWGI